MLLIAHKGTVRVMDLYLPEKRLSFCPLCPVCSVINLVRCLKIVISLTRFGTVVHITVESKVTRIFKKFGYHFHPVRQWFLYLLTCPVLVAVDADRIHSRNHCRPAGRAYGCYSMAIFE